MEFAKANQLGIRLQIAKTHGVPAECKGEQNGTPAHVLVADPTEGYGIFIENMLNAADFTELGKAA